MLLSVMFGQKQKKSSERGKPAAVHGMVFRMEGEIDKSSASDRASAQRSWRDGKKTSCVKRNTWTARLAPRKRVIPPPLP